MTPKTYQHHLALFITMIGTFISIIILLKPNYDMLSPPKGKGVDASWIKPIEEHKPDIILVGNSMLQYGIDTHQLSSLMGKDLYNSLSLVHSLHGGI